MRFYTHFSKPDARYIRVFCRQELIPLIALVGSKIFYRALVKTSFSLGKGETTSAIKPLTNVAEENFLIQSPSLSSFESRA